MIRHIVFFTVRAGNDVETVRRHLLNLKRIPHHDHFEVVENGRVDPMGNEIDLVVYGEFRDPAALAAFKADPIYDETTRIVRPLRESRHSADYEVPDR